MKVTFTIETDNFELVKKITKIIRENEPEDRMDVSISNYARFFDESCHAWSNDSELNLAFLKTQEKYANELLRARGYLFLNEVYDMLGIPRSKAGQIVGWRYDPEDTNIDNCVYFGIFEDHNQEFVNGYKKTALLDFNVDGNILDAINKEETP